MLSFKTRYTVVEIGETVKFSRKSKNSLEESYNWVFLESCSFTEKGGYLRIGAYIIHIEADLEERIISLIYAYFTKPYENKGDDTIIHCKGIKIQELSEL